MNNDIVEGQVETNARQHERVVGQTHRQRP